MAAPDGAADVEHMNGRNAQDSQPRLRRSAFRALVQDFSPIWFTWCMNAGILAILTHQCPYQFPGLKNVISPIFFVLDLVLFVTFSLIFIARLALFRKQAYLEITNSIVDLTLVACWPIAWMTLTSLVSLDVSQTRWGSYPFTIVGYVMWWFVAAWSFIVLFWVFITLIRRHDASDRRLPTTIILPAVSVSTLSVTGAIVASESFHISAKLAIPVIIVSFMSVGVGILMGFMLYTFLFHQLLAKGFPPSEQIVSMFIFIGPVGQSAAALQVLGAAAKTKMQFADFDKGTFLTAEGASALDAACTLVALLFFGLGFVWTVFSVYAMIECAVQKNLKWSPIWNAIIFPTGTLTTSSTEFAIELDSPAFRVVTTGLLIILILVFLLNLAFTVQRISKGQLLIVREDPRVKAQIESDQKER